MCTGGYSLPTGARRIGAVSEGFLLLVLVPGPDHTSIATEVIAPVLFFCAELDVKTKLPLFKVIMNINTNISA